MANSTGVAHRAMRRRSTGALHPVFRDILAAHGLTKPERRVIVDRRSDETTARWLDGVDRRRNEFRFGRRDLDQAPEPRARPDRCQTCGGRGEVFVRGTHLLSYATSPDDVDHWRECEQCGGEGLLLDDLRSDAEKADDGACWRADAAVKAAKEAS